ncbi:DUF4190 domain-containing protein [Streptomyces gulbargensis]|uniref:DUF4190 domain-containing protein n=1 Tax=Streptomyces gulbargensis TaxID=364901 RepID=A0ABP7MQ03_9ACTN
MEPTPPTPQPPSSPGHGGPASGPYAAPDPYAVPGPYTSPGMPYAAGPYGPPGAPGAVPGPYGRPPRTTSGLAVASFVSGVVCCLPPLGLVLGLIALPRLRARDQAGKGLAVAGIVLSAVSCLLLVVALVTGGFSRFWQEFRQGMEEAARSDSAFSLRTGQCFVDHGKSGEYATDVEIVDCARPHDGEVTGGFKVTGFDGWPGEPAIDRIAEKRCEALNSAYALDTWAVPENVWVYYYLPSEQSWRFGDRTVTCALATEGKPFAGALRSDATVLDADQVHFLKTMNPIEAVVLREPERDPDEDFAANKAWAGQVLAAVDGARAGLGKHPWPDTARRPVAELGTDLDAAAEQWRELAGAADPDAYWEAYDRAFELLPEDTGAGARTALGLTDTLPGGGTGGSGDGPGGGASV